MAQFSNWIFIFERKGEDILLFFKRIIELFLKTIPPLRD